MKFYPDGFEFMKIYSGTCMLMQSWIYTLVVLNPQQMSTLFKPTLFVVSIDVIGREDASRPRHIEDVKQIELVASLLIVQHYGDRTRVFRMRP